MYERNGVKFGKVEALWYYLVGAPDPTTCPTTPS